MSATSLLSILDMDGVSPATVYRAERLAAVGFMIIGWFSSLFSFWLLCLYLFVGECVCVCLFMSLIGLVWLG